MLSFNVHWSSIQEDAVTDHFGHLVLLATLDLKSRRTQVMLVDGMKKPPIPELNSTSYILLLVESIKSKSMREWSVSGGVGSNITIVSGSCATTSIRHFPSPGTAPKCSLRPAAGLSISCCRNAGLLRRRR